MRRESDMQVLIESVEEDVRDCLWQLREEMVPGSNGTDDEVQPPNPPHAQR